MLDIGGLALLVSGFGLGLRHGIDWDHIAAITDITGSAGSPECEKPSPHSTAQSETLGVGARRFERTTTLSTSRTSFFLATLYALGHASVVIILGLLAIWTSAILPTWIDPLMERAVGVTLLLLGIWIFYSLYRYGRQFRLRSRWMLVFDLVGHLWSRLKSRVTGVAYTHNHRMTQYGRRAAFGIGVLHGIGAETGSQALLIASAAGATTVEAGSAMLIAFVIGLIVSNSLIAALSTVGFASARTRQRVYLATGVIAGVFSLVVGMFFVTGAGSDLPDLQHVIDYLSW